VSSKRFHQPPPCLRVNHGSAQLEFSSNYGEGLTAYIMQRESSKNIMHCARMQALRIQIDELVTMELRT
jgi:hypothetical protein